MSVLLAVAAMPSANLSARRKGKKDLYSVRMGDLAVTVTAVSASRIPKPRFESDNAFSHVMVRVHVKFTNAGKQFPCTEIEPLLEVRPFYRYRLDRLETESVPNLRELLPGETIEGEYAFEVREGVRPVALVLKARDIQDERCTLHPDWASIWHARYEASLPLEGLPSGNEGYTSTPKKTQSEHSLDSNKPGLGTKN